MGAIKYNAIRIAKQLCYSENVINKIKAVWQKCTRIRIEIWRQNLNQFKSI